MKMFKSTQTVRNQKFIRFNFALIALSIAPLSIAMQQSKFDELSSPPPGYVHAYITPHYVFDPNYAHYPQAGFLVEAYCYNKSAHLNEPLIGAIAGLNDGNVQKIFGIIDPNIPQSMFDQLIKNNSALTQWLRGIPWMPELSYSVAQQNILYTDYSPNKMQFRIERFLSTNRDQDIFRLKKINLATGEELWRCISLPQPVSDWWENHVHELPVLSPVVPNQPIPFPPGGDIPNPPGRR